MSMTDKPLVDESEWEAQERGKRAAPGRDAAGLDAAAAAYRIVAKTVVSIPRSEPPDDFAAAVVKRIARQDAELERLLSRILLVVFVAACIVVGVQYGGQWWQALHRTLGDAALGWMVAGTGCLTLSWVLRQLFERGIPAGDPVTG